MDEAQGRVGQPDSILKLGAQTTTSPIIGSATLEQVNSVDELPEGVAVAFSAPAGRCFNPFDEDRDRH